MCLYRISLIIYVNYFLQIFRYLQSIINYRTAVRTNNPLLKTAARRAFSPVWSGRRHPIYCLIEVADEVQLMRLNLTIRNIIESNNVVSWSGLLNQHQGLDAVLEEINKTLKTLIPPIPQMRHWKIAARNCKKFLQVIKSVYSIANIHTFTFRSIYCNHRNLAAEQFLPNDWV